MSWLREFIIYLNTPKGSENSQINPRSSDPEPISDRSQRETLQTAPSLIQWQYRNARWSEVLGSRTNPQEPQEPDHRSWTQRLVLQESEPRRLATVSEQVQTENAVQQQQSESPDLSVGSDSTQQSGSTLWNYADRSSGNSCQQPLLPKGRVDSVSGSHLSHNSSGSVSVSASETTHNLAHDSSGKQQVVRNLVPVAMLSGNYSGTGSGYPVASGESVEISSGSGTSSSSAKPMKTDQASDSATTGNLRPTSVKPDHGKTRVSPKDIPVEPECKPGSLMWLLKRDQMLGLHGNADHLDSGVSGEFVHLDSRQFDHLSESSGQEWLSSERAVSSNPVASDCPQFVSGRKRTMHLTAKGSEGNLPSSTILLEHLIQQMRESSDKGVPWHLIQTHPIIEERIPNVSEVDHSDWGEHLEILQTLGLEWENSFKNDWLTITHDCDLNQLLDYLAWDDLSKRHVKFWWSLSDALRKHMVDLYEVMARRQHQWTLNMATLVGDVENLSACLKQVSADQIPHLTAQVRDEFRDLRDTCAVIFKNVETQLKETKKHLRLLSEHVEEFQTSKLDGVSERLRSLEAGMNFLKSLAPAPEVRTSEERQNLKAMIDGLENRCKDIEGHLESLRQYTVWKVDSVDEDHSDLMHLVSQSIWQKGLLEELPIRCEVLEEKQFRNDKALASLHKHLEEKSAKHDGDLSFHVKRLDEDAQSLKQNMYHFASEQQNVVDRLERAVRELQEQRERDHLNGTLDLEKRINELEKENDWLKYHLRALRKTVSDLKQDIGYLKSQKVEEPLFDPYQVNSVSSTDPEALGGTNCMIRSSVKVTPPPDAELEGGESSDTELVEMTQPSPVTQRASGHHAESSSSSTRVQEGEAVPSEGSGNQYFLGVTEFAHHLHVRDNEFIEGDHLKSGLKLEDVQFDPHGRTPIRRFIQDVKVIPETRTKVSKKWSLHPGDYSVYGASELRGLMSGPPGILPNVARMSEFMDYLKTYNPSVEYAYDPVHHLKPWNGDWIDYEDWYFQFQRYIAHRDFGFDSPEGILKIMSVRFVTLYMPWPIRYQLSQAMEHNYQNYHDMHRWILNKKEEVYPYERRLSEWYNLKPNTGWSGDFMIWFKEWYRRLVDLKLDIYEALKQFNRCVNGVKMLREASGHALKVEDEMHQIVIPGLLGLEQRYQLMVHHLTGSEYVDGLCESEQKYYMIPDPTQVEEEEVKLVEGKSSDSIEKVYSEEGKKKTLRLDPKGKRKVAKALFAQVSDPQLLDNTPVAKRTRKAQEEEKRKRESEKNLWLEEFQGVSEKEKKEKEKQPDLDHAQSE